MNDNEKALLRITRVLGFRYWGRHQAPVDIFDDVASVRSMYEDYRDRWKMGHTEALDRAKVEWLDKALLSYFECEHLVIKKAFRGLYVVN